MSEHRTKSPKIRGAKKMETDQQIASNPFFRFPLDFLDTDRLITLTPIEIANRDSQTETI